MAAALLVVSACLRAPPPPPALEPAPPEPPPNVVLRAEHVEPDLVVEPPRHRVQPGETVYRIARAYGVTPDELMAVNSITDPRTLSVGQELVIPVEDAPLEDTVEPAAPPAPVVTPVPAKAEGAPDAGVASRPPAPPPGPPIQPLTVRPAERHRPADDDPDEPVGQQPSPTEPPREKKPAAPPASRPLRTGTLKWPVRGVLYARFGKKGKEPHDGIDLAAPAGTPVATAGEGMVIFAGEQKGYGQIVIVEHAAGLITLYAHNRDIRVKTGQKVREGQVVATVGESGRTSGPHLHFEVRKDGVPVDPLEHLGPIPSSARAAGGR